MSTSISLVCKKSIRPVSQAYHSDLASAWFWIFTHMEKAQIKETTLTDLCGTPGLSSRGNRFWTEGTLHFTLLRRNWLVWPGIFQNQLTCKFWFAIIVFANWKTENWQIQPMVRKFLTLKEKYMFMYMYLRRKYTICELDFPKNIIVPFIWH